MPSEAAHKIAISHYPAWDKSQGQNMAYETLVEKIDAAIREAVKAEREAILLLVASEREPSADDAPSCMIDGTITARDAAIAAVRATKRCINDRIRARTPQQENRDA